MINPDLILAAAGIVHIVRVLTDAVSVQLDELRTDRLAR